MTNFKRFVSGILSLIMVMFMFESIPVYAKTGTETYTYEGYTVEYIVSNEWTGNQSVEVKITNTGEESILNWALKYDAKGEISGLWNAVSVSNEGNAYLIKNSGYNYEIAPNESVTFGYTLSGENLSVPEKFELCSKRVDTKEENYTAVLNITEEWDTGFKAELIVSNVSDSPIEAWQFSFDSNFTVSDIWDCRLLGNNDGRYTVASEAWINPIQSGSSVTIGIVGIKEEGKYPEISGVTLSEVVIDDTLPEVQEPVGEMFIAAFGEYIKETETIDILWMSTQTEGTFEILMSDDNEEYTVAGSVQNADNYSIPADFVKKYIKVRQTNGNQTAESEPFVVMMTPTGYTVDFIDSDNDGLYDYIEDAVGTDKNLSDTDNDDLTDYEEVYLLGTDPVVYDSIVSGTSDGDADPDNDGLSNRYELDNGTNPLCDDTDSDGLTDGEEIGTYGTDPVKYDTDEDNIGDGDEITLGLNPLDSSTDGTPDSERIFEQKITSDSDIMSHINTEDNAFSMSIDISAAGNAENSISVSESGYSAVIQSDAVLGTIPEISYASGLSVEEVRVNFEIKDEYLENTLGTYSDCEELSGIKRLNIFRYFEEENILLPIETKFDIENNMVYTNVDRVGTYCLIDMEKWFESIGVDYSDTQGQSMTISYDNHYDSCEVIENLYGNSGISLYSNNAEKKDEFNEFVVVFGNANFQSNISDILSFKKRVIFHNAVLATKQYSNYKITILNDDNKPIVSKNGKDYATNVDELRELCDNIKDEDFNSDYKNQKAFEFYCYLSMGHDEKTNKAAHDMLEGVVYKGMDLQTLFKNSGWDVFEKGILIGTGVDNINIVLTTNFLKSDEEYNPEEKPLQIITATGLEPLPYDFKTPIKNDDTDYDEDGLSDWEEFDTELYKLVTGKTSDFNIITAYDLPTMSQMKDYVRNKNGDEFDEMKDRLDNAISRFANNTSSPNSIKSDFESIRILPIKSDPTKIDSDGDDLLDNVYENPKAKNEEDKVIYDWVKNSDKYFNIDDPNPLKKEIVWQWPAYYSDGTSIGRLQSAFGEIRSGDNHNGIDITPKQGKKEGCKAVASYEGTVRFMRRNSSSAGNYIEIEHMINGEIYISRYLHLKEFNYDIYEQYISGKTVNIRAGDIIGIIGDTASPGAVHLHYTLCKGTIDNKIDPLCFDINITDDSIQNSYFMFMKLPIDLRNTCDYNCSSCNEYFEKIEKYYNFNETDWSE